MIDTVLGWACVAWLAFLLAVAAWSASRHRARRTPR